METTTLIKSTSTPSHISKDDFRHQSYVFMAVLLVILTVEISCLLSTVAVVEERPNTISLWIYRILTVVTTICLGMVLHGYYIWQRGPLPLQKDPDAKYIQVPQDNQDNPTNRTVEYYVWGSLEKNATPLIVLHGSGTTGKYFNQHLFPSNVMKQLNVKVISPSYPGHGGSDNQPYRKITDWPNSDLLPILEREQIDKFLVIGSSYGTAHAMATASALPNRCLGMGLNVPYLPESVCREFQMWTDADMIFREQQLERPWILLPLFSGLSLFQGLIPKGVGFLPEGKQAIQEGLEIIRVLQKDTARSFLRGVNGQAYEMGNAETTQTWPDPRTIKIQNMVVWYAKDDKAVPPDHGKWLAEHLTPTNNNLNVKCDQKGLGHFTYMTPEHCQTGVMTKVLLEMLNSEK